MKKFFGLVSMFAVVIATFVACGNAGGEVSANECSGVPDGRLMSDGQICKCGAPYSAADYATYKDLKCANGGGTTTPTNACGLNGRCEVVGTTCVDDSGREFTCCDTRGWLPSALSCPTTPADTGTNTDTGTTPTDTGSTPVDTGTAPSGTYWYRACVASSETALTKSVRISNFGSGKPFDESSRAVDPAGIGCYEAFLPAREGSQDIDVMWEFTKAVSFTDAKGVTFSQDHINSCYIWSGPFSTYGSLVGKKPDGSACSFQAVANGAGGCNLRCN